MRTQRPRRRWYGKKLGSGQHGKQRVRIGRSTKRDAIVFSDGRRDVTKKSVLEESVDGGVLEVDETSTQKMVRCELCGVAILIEEAIRTPGGHFLCERERYICCYEKCPYPGNIIEPPERAVFYPPLPERGLAYHRRCARRAALEGKHRRIEAGVKGFIGDVATGWLNSKLPGGFKSGGSRNGKKS